MLPDAFSQNGRFEVVVCDDEESASPMHMRYLFSAKGGVRLDKGLQIDNSAVVDLSFIDKSVHEDLIRKYVNRPCPYKVVTEYSYE